MRSVSSINQPPQKLFYIKGKKLIGTAKYVSLNVHYGIEASRRDDLESLCYCYSMDLKGFGYHSIKNAIRATNR